ncbi:hypothetical protein [Halegenticoccus tardaugens]|uniref:hypothetical protein n=1 Tax=Halegenticoccus tardaugens TaxID=2071624 RepID=UPI0013E987C2|nr:hypothetical protein [Halegenticoccus tardaugens]
MDSDSPIAPRTAGQTILGSGTLFTAMWNTLKSEFEFGFRAGGSSESYSHRRLAEGDGR